ncbi:Glyoxylate reductase 1 [Apiospora saccharicola]|uniref:Glyoxylate reductase 1 n=1 Tax=Apiospora saccharicola TaxID=335842 RepID=A0ABR1TMQ9_9PEZI
MSQLDSIPDELGSAVFYPTLHGLLAVADCVSLHTPLTAATRDLMDDAAFAAMENILAVVGEFGEVIGKPLTPVNEEFMRQLHR